MWDIINPARNAQTMPPRRQQKSEIMTPNPKGAGLVLPQISTGGSRPHLPEREDAKEDPPEDESPASYQVPRRDLDLSGSVGRIREIEILLLDTRGQLEKKMRQIAEELPSKLQRELTAIQNRDAAMWKDIQTKTSSLQESMNQMRESFRTQTATMNDRVSALQRKSDEAELRLISAEKNLGRVLDSAGKKAAADDVSSEEKVAGTQLQMELASLREQFADEKRRRETQLEDLTKANTELESRLRGQMGAIAQTVQRVQDMPRPDLGALAAAAKVGGPSPTKGEMEYLSSQVTGLEKRVDEEMNKRVRLEEDLLKYLEEKVFTVKEKVKQEERGSLEREKKMLGNIQEGLVTINEIMRGTNEEAGLKLTKVETELSHHIEALGQMVDTTTKAFSADLAKQGEELRIVKQKAAEFEESSLSNLQSVTTVLQGQIFRLESKLMDTQKAVAERQDEVTSEIQRQEKMAALTKEELGGSIASVKKETAAALAGMKDSVEASNNHMRERAVMLKYDLDEARKALDSRCSATEKSVNVEVTKLDQKTEKRVSEFVVSVDENVRTFTAKMNDAIVHQKDLIDSNRKSNDEHIRQQANAIKALSRAFTEKEAAERKQYVDELGLRVAKRLTEFESATHKRFLNLEVDAKNYVDKRMQALELDFQPRLAVERILATLENEERQQQIAEMRKLVQNSAADCERKIAAAVEPVNRRLSEVRDELVVREEMQKIADKISEAQIGKRFEGLEKMYKASVTDLKGSSGNLAETLDKLRTHVDRIEIGLRDEVLKSVTSQIATTVSVNTVETKTARALEDIMNSAVTSKAEFYRLLDSAKEFFQISLSNLSTSLIQSVATCAVDQAANEAALQIIERSSTDGSKRGKEGIETLVKTNKDVLDQIELRTKTMLSEMDTTNKAAVGKLETEIAQMAKSSKESEEALEKKQTEKIVALTVVLDQIKKENADILAAKLEEAGKSKVAQSDELGKKLEENNATIAGLTKQLEETKTERKEQEERTAKRMEESQAKLAEVDAATKKVRESFKQEIDEILAAQELTSKLQEQFKQELAEMRKKMDASAGANNVEAKVEERLKSMETKEKSVEATEKKLKDEYTAKMQEVLGTVNNEIESMNKKIEMDLSQSRIDMDKRFENSMKSIESRITAVELSVRK